MTSRTRQCATPTHRVFAPSAVAGRRLRAGQHAETDNSRHRRLLDLLRKLHGAGEQRAKSSSIFLTSFIKLTSSPWQRRTARQTVGLDPGSANPYKTLWALRRSLMPGVFTQVHELPTEAAARRWRGRVDLTQRLPKLVTSSNIWKNPCLLELPFRRVHGHVPCTQLCALGTHHPKINRFCRVLQY